MHICFVALNSYNLFSSSNSLTHIGGAETQQFLMARWLVQNGHQVTVVVRDHEQAEEEIINGIRLVKSYNVERGLPIVRFFHPRWSGLVRALRTANADIYYQRGAGIETGQVALWCRRKRKAFVFGSASNADCDSTLPFLKTLRDRALYKLGLRLASAVVVQSKQQAELLQNSFGLSGEVIYSSGRVLGDAIRPGTKSLKVIWLGRLSPQKRFEWVLDAAMRSEDYEFLILGASNDGSDYARQMHERAEAIANVKLVGHVSQANVVDYYSQARFLILTSPLEGFPNVFLEAWQLGLPVITTFDPDDLVKTERLGWHVDSPEAIAKILDEFESQPEGLGDLADHVVEYFEQNHTADKNMPRYVELFERVMSSA